MKKIFLIILSMLIGLVNFNVYAGSVQDNNEGKSGQILIHSGNYQRKNNIGTWVDSNEFRGEKGDRGNDGIDGIDGYSPIKGIDYFDGQDGEKGDTGEKGYTGDTGNKGDKGLDGYTPIKDIDYFDGKDGIDGIDGKDVNPVEVERLDNKINNADINISDNLTKINQNKNTIIDVDNKHKELNNKQDNTLNDHNNRITSNANRIEHHEERIGDLEDTQYCVRGEVQFIRKENLTVGVYGKTDVRHPNINNEVGINIIIGLGKSEAQGKRENLEKRVANLEKKLGWIGIEPEVKKTETGWEISIKEEDKIKLLNRF